METRYALYVEGSFPGTSVADYLVAQGATRGPDPDDLGDWLVPADARRRVRAELQRRSVDFLTFHEFLADSGDSVDDLAAHLGITYLTGEDIARRAGASSGPLFVKDADDFRIVANDSMLELLAPVVDGLTWEPYEKVPGLSFLSDATVLPDPIELVEPRRFEQLVGDSSGLWDISNDGRKIVTQRNLDHLSRHGIAYSTAFSADGRIYPRKKFGTFGGKAIEVARQAGVDMVIYLPHEKLEIEQW